MLYNTVLVSALHQHVSAIGIHLSAPSWTSLPPPTPSHPSQRSQSPGLSSLSHLANSHRQSMDLVSFFVRVRVRCSVFLLKYQVSKVPREVLQTSLSSEPDRHPSPQAAVILKGGK